MAYKAGGPGGENGKAEGDIMCLTPATGFDIRQAAPQIKKLMKEWGAPVAIRLPSGGMLEFDPDCTRQEIIDGYLNALKNGITATPANGD